MEGKRLLRSLTLRNVLSFGPKGTKLEFEPLNVLVGPNGSGKSNLIEILGLLKGLPRDLSDPIRKGGGISVWVWNGSGPDPIILIKSEWVFGSEQRIEHGFLLKKDGNKPRLGGEVIVNSAGGMSYRTDDENVHWFSDIKKEDFDEIFENRLVVRSRLKPDQSILAQIRDSDSYPELAFLSDQLSDIRLFRNWIFGPDARIRDAQRADAPGDFLLPDASNLGLILNNILLDHRSKTRVLENLRALYGGAHDIRTRVVAGFIEINIEEDDEGLISAKRLSDGTLRYLSLLAILCHPEPPPLICIEEPELGLHPDLMTTIAKLLIDASQRTQLIVTTHSADLVSALGEVPEAVVVCEKGIAGTTLKRLDPKEMKGWLERYTLGHLWATGEIGGNRW